MPLASLVAQQLLHAGKATLTAGAAQTSIGARVGQGFPIRAQLATRVLQPPEACGQLGVRVVLGLRCTDCRLSYQIIVLQETALHVQNIDLLLGWQLRRQPIRLPVVNGGGQR